MISIPFFSIHKLVSRQFYNLPSLNALAAFEAVARHESLTVAAAELGVTPGAVSRQIKLLETEIGVPLFTRSHKKVHCNHQARELQESLKKSFAHIGATIGNLRAQVDDSSFTLGSTTAFSSLWLMPRLNQFWKQHPHIRINHHLSDDTKETLSDGVDLSIRYESGKKSSQNVILLFRDEIYPVCSPRLAGQLDRVTTPEQLTSLPLLQLTHSDRSWTDWRAWLNHFNISAPLRELITYNNYIIALQAALDDQGIILGWDRLVKPLVEQGKLMRLTDISCLSPGAYYLHWHSDRVVNQATKTFVEWLENQK